MLFLLPPSETKRVGGLPLSINQVALTFGGLNAAREQVFKALDELGQPLLDAPTMPAVDRFAGTLFDALHGRGLKGTPTQHNQLSPAERAVAKQLVLIQTAPFGLIPADDLIPEYRLSAGDRPGGINLAKLWPAAHETSVWPRLAEQGPIIDLRSKAYAELAPIPAEIEHYVVEVELVAADGTRKRLNHFNKKAKGQLVRAALQAKSPPASIKDLAKCAKAAGLGFKQTGGLITLQVSAL